jgi:hypothetical protein
MVSGGGIGVTDSGDKCEPLEGILGLPISEFFVYPKGGKFGASGVTNGVGLGLSTGPGLYDAVRERVSGILNDN